jgi:hypothetical protein
MARPTYIVRRKTPVRLNECACGCGGFTRWTWVAGHHMKTPPYREMNSRVHKGMRLSDEARAKLSEAKTGKRHTEESKRKMSEARRRHWEALDPEERRRRTDAWSEAGGKWTKGHRLSEEAQEKIAESVRGRRHREESLKKMSEARKLWWERKRKSQQPG